MTYTIETYRRFSNGVYISDIVYSSTNKNESIKYFTDRCEQANKTESFIEFNIYEWYKPDVKVLIDTWNNGYKTKE